MKNDKKIGIVLAVLGILTGLLTFYLMADIYNPTIAGKILDGRPDEAVTVQITFALLGWLGISAGALWGTVLYGFVKEKPWAWFWGVVASTVQMLVGFFPIIPPASIGMPFPTIWVFLLAGVLWFGMMLIGRVDKKLIALTFAAGLAYVLTFMDGVGVIAYFQLSMDESLLNGMFAMAQQVTWWGAAAWAIFIFAVIKKKEWAVPLGIFAALMSMLGGYPMGISNMLKLGRFSLFLPAPVLSTILLIVILLPGTHRLITRSD
jgi:hypothetical protein